MKTAPTERKLPRSIRKHLRNEKARIRRELGADDARRTIEQLVRRFRHPETPR